MLTQEPRTIPRPGAPTTRPGRIDALLSGASLLLMLAALYFALVYAPTERVQGNVQRIFYFHVPLAWVAYLAFFVVFVASIAYLRTRSAWWDALARSSAEVGLLFTTLVLITGSLWARPIWGTWWSWDARLTTSLILWFIYVGYLLVRSSVADRQRGARFGAVLGIVGFVVMLGGSLLFATSYRRTGGLSGPRGGRRPRQKKQGLRERAEERWRKRWEERDR